MTSQAGNAQALPDLSNEDFLKAVFRNSWYRAHVTGFAGNPSDPKLPRSLWTGGAAGSWKFNPDHNNYFAVSLFTGPRQKQHFDKLIVLGVDDIGPKVSADKVRGLMGEPSYRIETSPGNEQWGYVLERPLTVEGHATNLIAALIKALVGEAPDPGMANVTRYLRLPAGVNHKSSANGFRTRLVELNRGRLFSESELNRLSLALSVADPDPTTQSVRHGGQSSNVVPGPGVVECDLWFQAMRKLDLVLGGPRNSAMGRCYDLVCPWVDEHTDRASSGTAYVPVLGRFECHHGHCQGRTGEHLPAKLDALLVARGLGRLVDVEFPDLPVDVLEGPWAKASPPLPASDLWRDGWQRSARGQPASNFKNVMLALREAPELGGVCGLNEFGMKGMLLRELPGVETGHRPVPREWRDEDTMALHEWLQGQGLRSVGLALVEEAVTLTMRDNARHPLREWLEGLTWDGVSRIDSWLVTYAGVTQSAYHAHVGAWFLMGMCRRVAEPGCRQDYMLVLEGPQGIGKSTLLRTLAGEPEWFSDNLPDISNKDAAEHTAGCWLIEIAEMDRFNRAESSAMKAFVSRRVDRIRMAYGHRTMNLPRQCVLAGTSNLTSWAKDGTGNRRYWPVETGAIDIDGLSAVREQLFAEAWHRVVTLNEPYWPDPLFEELNIEPVQDARLEADLWEEDVQDFLQGKDRVTVTEVVVACTGGSADQKNQQNQRRVTLILGRLGWKRGARGHGGKRFWYPIRPKN